MRSQSRRRQLSSSLLVCTPIDDPTFLSHVDAAITHRINSHTSDPLGDRERVVEVQLLILRDGPRRNALHRRPFRRSLEAAMTMADATAAAADNASPPDGTFLPGQKTQQRGIPRCQSSNEQHDPIVVDRVRRINPR